MIYALTTVTAFPTMAKRLIAGLEGSTEAVTRDLVGAWATDIGGVNDLVLLHRRPEPGAPAASLPWLRPYTDLVQTVATQDYRLFPHVSELPAGRHGPLYEMRFYTFRAGAIEEIIDAWREPLAARSTLSVAPLVFLAVGGQTQRLVHIWPYASFEQRTVVRAQAIAEGIWPALGGARRWLSQDSNLLVPLSFSPLT